MIRRKSENKSTIATTHHTHFLKNNNNINVLKYDNIQVISQFIITCFGVHNISASVVKRIVCIPYCPLK